MINRGAILILVHVYGFAIIIQGGKEVHLSLSEYIHVHVYHD